MPSHVQLGFSLGWDSYFRTLVPVLTSLRGTTDAPSSVFPAACIVCSFTQSCPILLQPHGLYVAHQASLPMEFSRQECWSGLPFPPPGNLPNPGMEPSTLVSLALAGRWILYQLHHLGSPTLLEYGFFSVLLV